MALFRLPECASLAEDDGILGGLACKFRGSQEAPPGLRLRFRVRIKDPLGDDAHLREVLVHGFSADCHTLPRRGCRTSWPTMRAT